VDQNNSRVFETGWGVSSYNCNTSTLVCTRTGWQAGAGGGVSKIFPEPSYQTNAGLSLTGRGVPDVAALADAQTGYLVGQTQTFQSCNGTVVKYDEYRLSETTIACPIINGINTYSKQK
jgi:subtilase family serine protease